MSSGPPSKTGEASSSTAKVERKKRVKFENGKLVEYWIDSPVEQPKPETKAASPLELFKEFKFEEDISLGRIFPSLQNTRFDALVMKNTSMIWLGKDASALKKAGLWFETDVEFRGLLQPAADILSEVFGQEHPGIHLSAHLGIQQEWTNELVATGFTFRGSIEGINRGFGEFLTFRNVGIAIDVVPDSSGHTATLWSFYGKLHLAIPNSVAPLVLNYKLEPKTDSLDISMTFGEGELWQSVFGVSGLNLDQVSFSTSIPKSDVKTSTEFSLTAKWSLGGVPIILSGHVSKAQASLRGYIESVSMNNLRQLFASLTGGKTLNPVEQDVRFSNLTIEIAKGRLMLYGEVWVDSYKVAAAEVLISVDGISISGAVEDLHLGEDINVEKAKLELIIGHVGQQLKDGSGNTKISTGATPGDSPKDVPSSNPDSTEKGPKTARKGGTPVAAIIRGTVKMKVGAANLTFNIAAAIVKPAHEPISFFVYGQLDGENLSIGSLLPDGDGGDLMDLTLRRVAIVASNAEVVQDYGLNVAHYPIKKGVFICAELEAMPFVDKLSKDAKADDRYVLHAGYSKETGLSVRVILPENVRIELSPNVRSGPLSLSIDTKPSLSIEFSAILWVIPDGQDPLELTLSLRANELDARGFAQMEGWWKNPLDLSPRLKIGPVLALQVAINYNLFLSTGTPSEIGFIGGLLVDEKDDYRLAFNLGTNPKQTLLSLQVRRLTAEEVITLVNAVGDFELESPKEEIIRFEDVDIYASPLGCLVGTKMYPPGFVVKGKAFILGKKVEIDCSLGSNGMKLKGEVEGFYLGPLGVHGGKRVDGTRGENPLIDLEITKERQHFEVSGSIELWSLEASVFVLVEIMPVPQLEFNFELSWSELVRFQVKGELIKDPANTEKGVLGSLDNADFKLYALMEQRILTSVAESMRTWFQNAQVSVDADIQAAKRKVDEAKAEFDRKIEVAKREVEETRKRFNEKMEAAQAGLREKEMQCANERAANERWIMEEEKRAEAETQAANSKLDAIQKKFEDDMEQKKRNLSNTRREGEEAINGKIRGLQDTRVSLQRDFGNAIEALERAEARVQEESWRVREAEGRVNQARSDYNNAAWYEKPFKGFQVGVLEAECFAIKCALGAAELILRGAKGIVEGVAYNAAKVAVDIAEGALVGARNMWAGAIAGAQSLLDGVVALHAGAIGLAKDAVTAAQAVALRIKKAAYVVRDQLIALHQTLLEAARSVVKTVAEGIDFIAFQSALAVLDKVQKDTTLVDMAKAGLDAANAVAQAALAAGAWLASKLASTLNIELIELTASLRAITGGGEFTIHVKGVVLGEPLDWRGTWSPRNTLAFIFELCAKLWNDFLADVGRLMIAMK